MAERRIGGAGGGSDPGKGTAAGRFVAAATLVVVVAATGGSLGGGAALSGTAADSAADAVAGQNLSARKVESKKSARKGRSDEAWRRMGLRTLKKTAKQDLRCVAHSTGQVREFFFRTPCTSLHRKLVAIGDGQGNAAAISVAWVSFRSRAQANAFERVETVQGSDDITPLAGALLSMADIRFTGRHYQSRRRSGTIVIAETEPATGHVSDDVLDALAEVAVLLPRS